MDVANKPDAHFVVRMPANIAQRFGVLSRQEIGIMKTLDKALLAIKKGDEKSADSFLDEAGKRLEVYNRELKDYLFHRLEDLKQDRVENFGYGLRVAN